MRIDRIREWIVFRLIGTPVEKPLRWVRSRRELLDRHRHPEWNSVRDEGREIELLLAEVIKPDSNCIDIGCHLGAVLQRMCALAPRGQHMAFEPTPYKWAWLKQRYSQVDVRCEALSDQAGEAKFFYQVDHSGFSGLRPHKSDHWTTESFSVRRVKLDDVVHANKVDFIKVDVEGAEPLVFKGAENVLRNWRPQILFECTQSGLELYNWTPTQMYELLCNEHGYRIYMVRDWLAQGAALGLPQFTAAMAYPAQAFNFFASTTPPAPA